MLLEEFGKKTGSKLPPEVEVRARTEKADALAKLYEGRFSVLCGRAGTGKTSVLKVFLYDLTGIGGFWRAFSVICLGGVLIGIGLVYQKLIFARPQVPPQS